MAPFWINDARKDFINIWTKTELGEGGGEGGEGEGRKCHYVKTS